MIHQELLRSDTCRSTFRRQWGRTQKARPVRCGTVQQGRCHKAGRAGCIHFAETSPSAGRGLRIYATIVLFPMCFHLIVRNTGPFPVFAICPSHRGLRPCDQASPACSAALDRNASSVGTCRSRGWANEVDRDQCNLSVVRSVRFRQQSR